MEILRLNFNRKNCRIVHFSDFLELAQGVELSGCGSGRRRTNMGRTPCPPKMRPIRKKIRRNK